MVELPRNVHRATCGLLVSKLPSAPALYPAEFLVKTQSVTVGWLSCRLAKPPPRPVTRDEEHEFFVQDNGPGVPVEERERIFEPFQRGVKTGEAEGTGIGLSVVKSVVLRHGGRVWVESMPGEGATFRFTLPRREPQVA